MILAVRFRAAFLIDFFDFLIYNYLIMEAVL